MNTELETVRQRYGGFDGRFPTGIMLAIRSPEQWDNLLEPKRLGPREIDELAVHDNARLFSIVSLATTLEHERRHFHDFMLSPLGSAILVERLSIVMNSIQAVAHLTDDPQGINTLPLPLPRWIELSADEQDDYLDSIGNSISQTGTHLTLIAPKLTPGDPLFRMLEIAGSSMRRVMSALTSRVQVSDSLSFSLTDVAECSSLIMQAQAIWSRFGESALFNFYDRLLDESQTTYGRMIALLINAHLPFSTMGALTTWALIGEADGPPPPARFVEALVDLTVGGCPKDAETSQLFDRWDRNFSKLTTAEVMRHSLDANSDLLSRRQQMAADTGNPLAAELAVYYGKYCAARQKLVERFLADPAWYTDPLRYLESLAPCEPLIALAGNFVHEIASLNARGIKVVQHERDENGVEHPTLIIAPPGNSGLEVHDINNAQDMLLRFLLADAITSEVTTSDDLDTVQIMKRAMKNRWYVLRLPL